jgi:UDP-N-acetylmuramoylalanine--D-glutamate ligase
LCFLRRGAGGNLGTPLSTAALQCLRHGADRYHAAVVEVSSYQMQLPGAFCPDAAVVINLTPDHLERHGR